MHTNIMNIGGLDYSSRPDMQQIQMYCVQYGKCDSCIFNLSYMYIMVMS